MTTAQEETTTIDKATQEAQAIWAQLDAEEGGTAAPAAPAAQKTSEAPTDSASADAAQGQSGEKPDMTQPTEAAQDPRDKAIEELRATIAQTQARLRNAEGHIGTLNSKLQQQQQVATQVANSGGDAPSAKELADAQKNPEAMKRLKEDYPQFAEALEAALDERLKSIVPAQPQGEVATPAQIAQMRNDLEVEISHKGWKQTVQTPEFSTWMSTQPRERQMLAESDSPQDAIRLLDLFKEDTSKGKPTPPDTSHLKSAAALPGSRTSGVKTKSLDEMTPAELWAYYDQVDKQKG